MVLVAHAHMVCLHCGGQRIILTKLIQKKRFNMQQPQRFAPQSIPPGHMARFAQPAFSVLFISFDSD